MSPETVLQINERLAAEPNGEFRRQVRAMFEIQVRRADPAVEADVCEIVAEEVMAEAGIGIVRCPDCGDPFASQAALDVHLREFAELKMIAGGRAS